MKPFKNLSDQGETSFSSAPEGGAGFIIGDFSREVKNFRIRYIWGVGNNEIEHRQGRDGPEKVGHKKRNPVCDTMPRGVSLSHFNCGP